MVLLPPLPTLALRALIPGLVVVVVAAVAVGLASQWGWQRQQSLWAGVAAGCAIGGASIYIVAAASRRPAAAGVSAAMGVQTAALGTFLLKLLGAGAVIGSGFWMGMKFPQLVILGVAYAAAAVCVQVLGCVIVARTMAAHGKTRAASGS